MKNLHFRLCLLVTLLLMASACVAGTRTSGDVTNADRQFWAFRPLADSASRDVKNEAWCRNAIDHFILAKLQENGLPPTAPASKQRLIRRVYFDLIGLQPTPVELDAMLKDESPDWYEKLVDRLLTSDHFGERWGRHWLDVARYADSEGYEADADRPGSFHYRDFVIKAFNQDLPYDTFVKWQLAGDEYQPDDAMALAATGFLAVGPVSVSKNNEGTPQELAQYRADEIDDMVSTTGAAFLGMTVACARCHDHKYDPIPTRDYYRLAAAFNSTQRVGGRFRSDEKHDAKELEDALREPLRISDVGAEPVTSYLLARGDPSHKLEEVRLGFLSVLEPERSPDRWTDHPRSSGAKTTFQRTALAEWMTDVDDGAGALLARVIVNRLWQHHFGVGLVATPSDFGTQGDRPTHPELLDWLASELIRQHWRLKPIHRLMLTSAAYMQDTTFDPAKAKIDPDDKLLWRRRPMRLEAEALRDAILATSGKLDLTMFGPAIKPAVPPEAQAGRNKDFVPRPQDDGPDQWRRSIYLFSKRSAPTPMFDVFDAPNPNQSCARRAQSTVSTQALILMDSAFVRRQAGFFEDRVVNDAGAKPEDRVRLAYRLALSRDPTPHEIESAYRFLGPDAGRDALVDFCHVLLTLDEFAYVD
jgi:hypothetical protein